MLAGPCIVIIYPRAVFFLSGVIVAPQWGQAASAATAAAKYPLTWLTRFLTAWSAIQALTPEPIIHSTMLDWSSDLRLALAGLAFVAGTIALAGIAAGHVLLGRVLRLRPVQWCGTISFSLYLWHPIVMTAVKRAMHLSGLTAAAGQWSQALFLALCLPLALLLSWASWRILEAGATSMLKRAMSRPLARRAAHRLPLQPSTGRQPRQDARAAANWRGRSQPGRRQ
jgi:peptidoglycan/LPS O-acetylase OafA/YrhL